MPKHRQMISGVFRGSSNRCRALRLACLLAAWLPVAASSAKGRLVVVFEGMDGNSGSIVCSLIDAPEQYLSKQHRPRLDGNLAIVEGKATWTIEDLAFGNYVISAYHDANANGVLDSGLFGIPVEDYGFSNDARGAFGPPDYEDAEFEFGRSGQTLTIRID